MAGSPIEKIMGLIDKMSDEDRSTIADTYYKKPEKELSSKVTRLKKIYEKLDNEEQNDFIKLCWARMILWISPDEETIRWPKLDWTWPEWVGVIIATESEEWEPEEEDLSDKK